MEGVVKPPSPSRKLREKIGKEKPRRIRCLSICE
jgi:hypothetical protein